MWLLQKGLLSGVFDNIAPSVCHACGATFGLQRAQAVLRMYIESIRVTLTGCVLSRHVGHIRLRACVSRAHRRGVLPLTRKVLHTGLADNGLDVLCVNYTNERMHQTFLARPTTSHVFHFCNVHS